MGVGFFRPTELHQDTTQGETSSTQVEPSTSQACPAPPSATHDEPNQEQDQDPHTTDEDIDNEPSNPNGRDEMGLDIRNQHCLLLRDDCR